MSSITLIFLISVLLIAGCTGSNTTKTDPCEKQSGLKKDQCYLNLVKDKNYSDQDEALNICLKIENLQFMSVCTQLAYYR